MASQIKFLQQYIVSTLKQNKHSVQTLKVTSSKSDKSPSMIRDQKGVHTSLTVESPQTSIHNLPAHMSGKHDVSAFLLDLTRLKGEYGHASAHCPPHPTRPHHPIIVAHCHTAKMFPYRLSASPAGPARRDVISLPLPSTEKWKPELGYSASMCCSGRSQEEWPQQNNNRTTKE